MKRKKSLKESGLIGIVLIYIIITIFFLQYSENYF